MSSLPAYHGSTPYIPLHSDSVKLSVRQHPQYALVTPENKEKGRKPVDPPPIVQMHVDHPGESHEHWLVNPFLFMMATLIDPKTEQPVDGSEMIGQCVSSLHKLKDVDNKEAGFFVFGDISCRKQGTFKLQFNLFDYDKVTGYAVLVDRIMSNEFQVVSTKEFKGLQESTTLSRSFSDQGVRLRLRKEPRTIASSGFPFNKKGNLKEALTPYSTAKRSWNGSSPESTTPSVHANVYGGGPVHDYYSRYDDPPEKRQRSDSDYGGSTWHPSHQARPSQYSASIGNGSHGWVGHQQSLSSDTTNSATGLLPSTQVQLGPAWQRGMQATPYSTPIVHSTGNSFYHSPNSTSNAFRYSLGDSYTPGYQNLQHYSVRGSGDALPTLTGLHTPTSMGDHNPASNQHQNYVHSPQTVQSQPHELRHSMQSFTGRGLSLDQTIPNDALALDNGLINSHFLGTYGQHSEYDQ